MSLRGAAAITGIGEIKPQRYHPGRTTMGLMAEASKYAIEDAGLRKEDIDGLLVVENPASFAEYMQIRPTYASGVTMMGASGATMVTMATAAINAGLCTNVLCVIANLLTEGVRRPPPAGNSEEMRVQFEGPYGPTIAATGGYALIAQRHTYEYGTTPEQRARVAVDQRFNAQANPNAFFYGQPTNLEDVLNSRMISDPLRLLECVMPTSGAEALIVSAPDRAKVGPHPPVYVLGAGIAMDHDMIANAPRITTTPVKISAARAFQMAGLGPRDMDMLSLYDCYTITVIVTLEDAGFCKKGEGGPFVAQTDMTYKGNLPINTHGGQLSFSQPGLGGGMSHVVESARQMMGRAGERQVQKLDYCFVNG